ncbi:hypothetical protein BDN72DRAFT_962457 [Pluteus cervinus]|uniref:Uncharacterized protein n=1 Tax=Pluteus cervinus TaxID=181527 RepID=A0ACD3AKX3_9AGAR|nr:hypothetical protein BDN72DRAFT_962457 [Pluteus cervinus]
MEKHTIVIDFQEMSIEKAESQIYILQHFVRKLRVARNALLPIHRLPPEILLSIFSLVGRRWEMHAGRSMLKITWVSHYWRELALGSPTLWTVITNSNLNWAEEWLARSGSAPLSIGLFDMEQQFAVASRHQFRFLFTHIPRMITFHYSQSELKDYKLVIPKRFWEAPALLLSSIKLDGLNLHGNFLSSIPNVRNMFLRKCQFLWEPSATNYPHLTSLHISVPHSTVSVRRFIALLHKMPSLQRLVVVSVFTPGGDYNTNLPAPTSDSPRLHVLKLDLDGAIEPALQFLRYALSWFTTNQTVISCSSNLAVLEDDHLPYLLSSFSSVISPKQAATIRLTYPALLNSFATLYINYGDVDPERAELGGYRTTLEMEIDEPQRLALLSSLQHNLGLTHVKAIKFDNDAGEFETSQLVEVFGALPNLQYFDFQADHSNSFDFLYAIEPGEDEMSPPLFAPLRVLGTILAEEVRHRLAKVLVKRKNLGCGIETVILDHECNEWDESTLGLLYSLVDIAQELGPEALEVQRALFTGAESVFWGSDFKSFGDD